MTKLTDILQEILDEGSETAKKAKAMGLTSMGFGRWGKDGKVTHISQNGTLTAVKSGAQGVHTKASSSVRGDDIFKKDKKPTNAQPKNTPTANTPATPQLKTTADIKPSVGADTQKPTGSFVKDKGTSILSATYVSLVSSGLDGKSALDKGLIPLKVKSSINTRWTRGDGAKHHDWVSVVPDEYWNGVEKAIEKDPKVIDKSLQTYIDSTGAKKIGQVKGEFDSSKYNDVYKLGTTLFVNRGNRVDIGSTSRLKNKAVWDFKK